MNKIAIKISPVGLIIDAAPSSASASLTTPVIKEYIDAPAYEGSYEISPTDETQTLNCANYRMLQNLVINPVPSNYGRIDWNGSYLTVS